MVYLARAQNAQTTEIKWKFDVSNIGNFFLFTSILLLRYLCCIFLLPKFHIMLDCLYGFHVYNGKLLCARNLCAVNETNTTE